MSHIFQYETVQVLEEHAQNSGVCVLALLTDLSLWKGVSDCELSTTSEKALKVLQHKRGNIYIVCMDCPFKKEELNIILSTESITHFFKMIHIADQSFPIFTRTSFGNFLVLSLVSLKHTTSTRFLACSSSFDHF